MYTVVREGDKDPIKIYPEWNVNIPRIEKDLTLI